MLYKDPFFVSLVGQKLIANVTHGGNRNKAEKLWLGVFTLLKKLYNISILIILWKVLLRLQSPLLIQKIRVGSRKYQIPTPIFISIQLKRGLRLLLDSIQVVQQFQWKYAASMSLLELVWVNKIIHASKQMEVDKKNRLILPLFVFKQEIRLAETRHLQHYRWK